MDVTGAVQMALSYAADLFKTENISNLGLEEVDFDERTDVWRVTVGFSRPWDYPGAMIVPPSFGGQQARNRSYKVVKIADGKVVSVTNRDV